MDERVPPDIAARWEKTKEERYAALFAASSAREEDVEATERLYEAYLATARIWREIGANPATPPWNREAADVAAAEYDRRAQAERVRLSAMQNPLPYDESAPR